MDPAVSLAAKPSVPRQADTAVARAFLRPSGASTSTSTSTCRSTPHRPPSPEFGPWNRGRRSLFWVIWPSLALIASSCRALVSDIPRCPPIQSGQSRVATSLPPRVVVRLIDRPGQLRSLSFALSAPPPAGAGLPIMYIIQLDGVTDAQAGPNFL